MNLLLDLNIEIIHDQFAEHHIGPAEPWAGIGVRDCTNCGLDMSMKNEAMMAGMASLVMMKGGIGLLTGFGEIIRNAFRRVCRPAALLGAHVGGGVHGGTMRFLERRTGQ